MDSFFNRMMETDMELKRKVAWVVIIVAVLAAGIGVLLRGERAFERVALAETLDGSPAAQDFDQKAALAKLREEIKGKEREPAETVFKNIQTLKGVPAGRLLAIMEMGYSRSLGVNCTHCHTPENWASEDKNKKQVARDMAAMVTRINGEALPAIKNLSGAKPTINCTTCHRGQTVPALSLGPPPPPANTASPSATANKAS
jgi:Photosynthetic reaction centre cytochrome C subunit